MIPIQHMFMLLASDDQAPKDVFSIPAASITVAHYYHVCQIVLALQIRRHLRDELAMIHRCKVMGMHQHSTRTTSRTSFTNLYPMYLLLLGSLSFDEQPVSFYAEQGRALGCLYFVKQNSVKLASEIPNVGMGISAVFAGRCNGVLLNERLAA